MEAEEADGFVKKRDLINCFVDGVGPLGGLGRTLALCAG